MGQLVRSEDSPSGVEFFNDQVKPLLVEHCFECHSARSETLGGNLRLDSRAGWQQGGDLGPTIVPGKANESLFLAAVRYTKEELQMPPKGKLPDHVIKVFEQWVRMGAPDPRTESSPAAETPSLEDGSHWAFQTPHNQPMSVPSVKNRTWPRNEIDRFILAQLETREMTPAPRASRRVLIRRATFDLTGLPPTAEEVDQFLQDKSADAYDRLLDRLLASPRYGERWGRFWLDVARYADSNGLDENIAHGNAWRYRNYVIRAFNHDKPYADFITEQLAGDLIHQQEDESFDPLIATGFLSLGPKVLAEVDETKMEMDIIDEQVDTVGRALLGLTFGCARCHDHKFDPISTEDYYALAGIFKSTRTMEHFTKIARWNERAIAPEAQQTQHRELTRRIDAAKKRLEELSKEKAADDTTKQQHAQLETEIKRLEGQLPSLPTAMAVADQEQPINLPVHVRGSHLHQGSEVPRGMPAVFAPDAHGIPKSSSGRLQLAQWLTDGRHPLTARVIVNRMWRWHFGRGLVETTDNFGRLGASPTHPALLDWLADRLVHEKWSLKAIHRLMMRSSTYQQSSVERQAESSDPENRYLSRMPLRRLEAEAIRDSILAVAGILDVRPNQSLLHVENRAFLFDHTSIDKTRYGHKVRSVYLPVIRNHLYDGFQLFDYTDASVVNGNRSSTTVAPQALFLMNSEMLQEAAFAFADRMLEATETRDAANPRRLPTCFSAQGHTARGGGLRKFSRVCIAIGKVGASRLGDVLSSVADGR